MSAHASIAKIMRLRSALMLSTILVGTQAHAQTSYDAADPTVVSGSVTFDRGVTTPGVEIYTISTPTAVLDFVPNPAGSGVINFQLAGTTAIYESTPGGPDFTVLNRIVPGDPTRQIAFNGNVISQLRDANNIAARGGSVWFYSPGGIVLGDTAVFDTGNLLLTTGDPTGGSGVIGLTTSFTLASTPDAGGIVNILSGAQINAPNAGSYVALVAPVVFQAGTVNVNGSAAYVAAETATLTYSAGLFQISVGVGTDSGGGFPLQHRGTTRFLDVGVASRAYLVAVPKNNAITATIGASSDIGFDIATTANVENGILVLSSGYRSLVDTTTTTDNFFQNPATARADLFFEGGGTVNAAVVAGARDEARITVTASTLFTSDVELRGNVLAHAGGSGVGHLLTIGGDLTLLSNAPSVLSGAPRVAGSALLAAFNGGGTQVAGNVLVDASAGTLFITPGATGAGTGGNATINALDGNVAIGGNATVRAFGSSTSTATGGSSNVFVSAGRTLTIGGSLMVNADGVGFADNATIGNTSGGTGIGGNARIAPSGTLNVNGAVSVSASGFGGNKTLAGVGSGGAGTGGSASLAVQPGSSVTLGSSLQIAANGSGGSSTVAGAAGGAATAGTAFINVGAAGQAALLDVTGAVQLLANATGGTGTGAPGGQVTTGIADLRAFGGTTQLRSNVLLNTSVTSGAGTVGGAVTVRPNFGAAITSASGTLAIGGNVQIFANGTGGASSALTATGVTAFGNLANLVAEGGALSIAGSATLQANGTGGTANGNGPTSGGEGRGGNITVLASSGSLTTGLLSAFAQGFGGSRNNGTVAARGGAAQGGSININADRGTLVATGLNANTDALGGLITTGQGAGGAGTGGTSQLGTFVGTAGGGGSVTVNGAATLSAIGTGRGTAGGTATAGAGTGGNARITANTTGTITITGLAQAFADGNGGAGNTVGGTGGAGTGTTASISQGGTGTVTVGAATLTANGVGGTSAAGVGGTGRGGDVRFVSNAGNIRSNAGVVLAAAGSGGGAVGAATAAGGGIGGLTNIGAGTGTTTVVGTATLDSTGNGGLAGVGTTAAGGIGTGGQALVGTVGTGTIALGAATLLASGFGGTGHGNATFGGLGTGGTAQYFGTVGTVSVTGNAGASAAGVGGQKASGIGGGSGAAVGGNAVGNASNGGQLLIGGNASLSAAATGGNVNNIGTQGTGGAANGGSARAITFGTGANLIDIGGTLLLDSAGGGGQVAAGGSGSGGNGRGGESRLTANTSGTITVDGIATVISSGFGGNGAGAGSIGGNGQGGTPPAPTGPFNQGSYIVADPGTIALGAGAQLISTGQGGIGATGGNGTGGRVSIVAFGGSISTPTTAASSAVATGTGGNALAGFGGAGGNGATASIIEVFATSGGSNTPVGTASSVTLGDLTLNQNTRGGAGGSGAAGQAGGRGGDAASLNNIQLFAHAGNGTLTAGNVTLLTNGDGGIGGTGGTGATGAAGGAGGNGTGGFINFGTASGPDTLTNNGSTTFGVVTATSNGRGGTGGAGGTGTIQGVGGAGGIGNGGGAVLQSRGSPVVAGNVTLNSNGNGGVGGVGSTQGAGGDAEGGSAVVTATSRFMRAERGFLNLGDVRLNSTSNGGAGSIIGGRLAGESDFIITDSNARLASLSALTTGTPRTDAFLSNLSVQNGTVDIVTGNLDFLSGDDIGLAIVNGGVVNVAGMFFNVQSLQNILADGPAGATPGTVNAAMRSTVRVNNGNLAAAVNIRSQGDSELLSNGVIVAANIESVNGTVTVDGIAPSLVNTGGITLGMVSAGNSVAINTVGAITTGNITAGTAAATVDGNVQINGNGAIMLGNVTGDSIDIGFDDSLPGPFGNITTGALAAQTIEVESGANLTIASATTSDRGVPPFPGENDLLVAVGAVGDLTIGTINGASSVGLLAGGNLTTGTVTAADSVVALAGGTIALGGVLAGQNANESVFLSNISILGSNPAFADVESPLDFDEFDFTALAGLTPVRTSGAISITGPVSAGNFIAASGAGFTAAAIAAPNRLFIDAAGAIATGALSTNEFLFLQGAAAITTGSIVADEVELISIGGSIATGAIAAPNGIELTAAAATGNITTGALLSGDGIAVQAGGNVNVTSAQTVAGTGLPGDNGIGVAAGGSLQIGAVTSIEDIGLLAQAGGITAGNLVAGGSAVLLASTTVSTGSIQTSQAAGELTFIANASQFALLGGSLDPAVFLTVTPVRTAGDIVIGGPVTTALFRAGSGGNFTAQGTMTASGRIGVAASGTASFAGLVGAPLIDVTSANIQLAGQSGALGTASTQTLNLFIEAPGQTITIGGDGAGSGYNLSAQEISRLRANEIVINARRLTNAAAADVIVGSFTINGSAGPVTSANLTGATSALRILTPDSIRVTGAVQLVSAAPGNTLFLGSRARTEIVTDQGGSITLSGVMSQSQTVAPLGGTLVLNGSNIAVGSASLLSQLALDPRFAERDALLLAPASTPRPEGFIQASRIELQAVNTVAIQNSGTRTLFGGFTSGTGGMVITSDRGLSQTPITTPVDVVIYGRVQLSDGSFLTNNDTRDAVSFVTGQGTAGFSTTSKVNNCLLSDSVCIQSASEEVAQEVAEIATDVQGVLDGELAGDAEEVADLPEVDLATVVDAEALTADVLVGQPVTSGGNPSLWEGGDADDPDDDDDDDEDEDEDGGDGQ